MSSSLISSFQFFMRSFRILIKIFLYKRELLQCLLQNNTIQMVTSYKYETRMKGIPIITERIDEIRESWRVTIVTHDKNHIEHWWTSTRRDEVVLLLAISAGSVDIKFIMAFRAIRFWSPAHFLVIYGYARISTPLWSFVRFIFTSVHFIPTRILLGVTAVWVEN